ncbi:MAG TPA: DUF4097 family beta strand repeat-containing protein [Candidatus Dormibacteraeota bacterium]|nr:DUF4097 family beta strand repeat-containing protein [Candidatus Dormibacteraeota bacterium]
MHSNKRISIREIKFWRTRPLQADSAGAACLRRVFLCCSAFVLLVMAASTAHADEWKKTYAISGRAQVRVGTNDGNVRVLTGDSKEVGVRVETHGMNISDREVRVNVRQEGDRIEADVRMRMPNSWCVFCSSGRSLKIEIRMPRQGDLTVETGDGSVEADALEGKANIHTGDGHIKLAGARGEIRLLTGDGHIEARNLDGQLEAKSGDGHIRIEGRFEGLNLNTGDGSIEVRVLPGSKISSTWTVHTGDGSVDLTLPNDFQANLDAHTNDGRISLGFPVTMEGAISKSEVRGKINGGGALLTVRTGDGSIRLTKS